MSFLKAEWRRLALMNYEVDPQILKPYLPYKTELDVWNNTHYVSLVGFMFLNTKVFGIKFPFHSNFEEINLRFYVRYKEDHQWKRGVVFVREIVPKAAITLIANSIYKEHYATRKMFHSWLSKGETMITQYGFYQDGRQNLFSLESSQTSAPIAENSETEFITEHYWGYSRVNDTKTVEYEVTHPSWEAYDVYKYEINLDFEASYGKDFRFLNDQEPKSVMLAEGSAITVENKRMIR